MEEILLELIPYRNKDKVVGNKTDNPELLK